MADEQLAGLDPMAALFRPGYGGARLSGNVEDAREGGGWNMLALKAIADRFGSTKPVDSTGEAFAGGVPVPHTTPGVNGKTPDNLGIEDLFTRSQEHPDDFDGQNGVENVLAKATARSTTTPNSGVGIWNPQTQSFNGDGASLAATPPPQTMTPNPNAPQPSPDQTMATIETHMVPKSPIEPQAAPETSEASLMDLLKSLFQF